MNKQSSASFRCSDALCFGRVPLFFKTKLIALMICLALFPAVEWSNLGRDLLPIPVSGAKPSNMGGEERFISTFGFLLSD